MKLYLAGPMRGYPEFNFPAFQAATQVLRGLGHRVFSPAERDINHGFDPSGLKGNDWELGPSGLNLREALGADLAYICYRADAVVVMDGWERSLGANAEVATARALGLPVYTMKEVVND